MIHEACHAASFRAIKVAVKRSPSTPRRGIALFSIIAAFVLIAAACSNQGEGERCEVDNRNEDCDTSAGLICYPAGQLNSSSDRCCPADRSKATNPICKAAVTIGVDATTPADTGPAPSTDGATSDAADSGDASDASDAEASADANDQ